MLEILSFSNWIFFFIFIFDFIGNGFSIFKIFLLSKYVEVGFSSCLLCLEFYLLGFSTDMLCFGSALKDWSVGSSKPFLLALSIFSGLRPDASPNLEFSRF